MSDTGMSAVTAIREIQGAKAQAASDKTSGMSEAMQAARSARAEKDVLAITTEEQRNAALMAMAQSLRSSVEAICAANAQDMEAARAKNTEGPLLDRLFLDKERIQAMASALEDLAQLPDPLNKTLERRSLANGLEIKRVSVPLGVVAVVYEARPNVTADAAGICIKSGNACVLRGGSLALHSNVAIANALREALAQVGLPKNCIVPITSADRSATDDLLKARGLVDVLIPRGGSGLIQHCVEHATVPVIETGVGNCHVYVDKSADLDMALKVIVNAKTQRPGVCNACESVLLHQDIASTFIGTVVQALREHNVIMHIDEQLCKTVRDEGLWADDCQVATEADWGREYLDLEISIAVVPDVRCAIEHINRYGTGHSEAIITRDEANAEAFCAGVDAAAVYVNASTRFTDGGEFGLGAEIGISTQKLHVRGPFALEALTTYKYIVRGTGQVRG